MASEADVAALAEVLGEPDFVMTPMGDEPVHTPGGYYHESRVQSLVARERAAAVEHEATGWTVHAEHVERTNMQRLHDLSVIDELKSLLRRACEADAREDCSLDHNGGCQAHGFLSEPCPYPLIRQYLDRDRAEAEEGGTR